MKKLITLLSLLLIGFGLLAQEELPPISTDRPDQSEAAATVPKNTFQIETGVLAVFDKTDEFETQDYGIPGILLRYGLFENFELRLANGYSKTNIKKLTDGSDSTSQGFIPLYAGFKSRITSQKGGLPELAIMAAIQFPNTGSQIYHIKNMSADLRLAGGWSIGKRFGIGFNIASIWGNQENGTSGFYSAVFGIGILPWLNAFIEPYGYFGEMIPVHMLDYGFTFPVRHNLQFDISSGVGLSESAPDWFLSAGLSWRVPR